MTYQRTDANHFARMFETGASDAGPWTQSGHEACTRLTVSGNVIAGSPAPSALQELALRIAGPAASNIFPGTLPTGWNATIPLPQGAKLIGSVVRGTATQVYYDLNTATIADYTATLQAGGWTGSSVTAAALTGGFGTRPLAADGPLRDGQTGRYDNDAGRSQSQL